MAVIQTLSIVVATVAMFVVGQSIFWVVAGSRQYENVVKGKASILSTFFESGGDPELHKAFCNHARESTTVTPESEKERNSKNMAMLVGRFLPFFALNFVMFVVSLVYILAYQRQKAMEEKYLVGLGLVTLSFATEIVIFIFVIKPYILIGDLEMLGVALDE